MLLNRVLANEVYGECPTERCTWPIYTTLAVCSTVEDISGLLQQNDTYGYIGNVFLPGVRPNKFEHDSTVRSSTSAYDAFGKNIRVFEDVRPTPPASNGRIADLAQVFIWYHDQCSQYDNPVPSKGHLYIGNVAHWRAFKASFQLCLQTYESSSGPTMESRLLRAETDIP